MMKAKFQHIRKAQVLRFEVDPYTNIDASELPFSREDLQYLRYHFEVFSAVSLFGLITDEKERIARLDAYLDMKDARIACQEQTHMTSQDQNPVPTSSEPEVDMQNEKPLVDIPHEHTPTLAKKDQAHIVHPRIPRPEVQMMGLSVLDNMDISMVHVLPAEFQPTAS
ncbi:hypothetical protein ACFX2J_000464 [Malus domestica]